MRIEVTRQLLEDNIIFTIEDLIKTKNIDDKVIFKNVVNKLYTRNIMIAELIISGSMTLDVIRIEELYHLAKALYEETGREKINPEEYFTEIEIKQFNKFKKEIKNKIDVPEFKDFIQVTNDQWIGVMKIKDIAKLISVGRVNYNFATQRESIIKQSKNGETIIMRPKTYENSVIQIEKNLENNLYIPDTITFNILKNGEDDFDYKNRNIKVFKGEINALDGWHRCRAIIRVAERYPDIDGTIEVRITNFDENKANRFIYQINQQNKIDERHLEAKNIYEYQSNVTNKINAESDMRGKIATDNLAIKQGRAVVGFEVLSKSIKYLFNIKNARDERIVGEFLVKFFNELYGIFFDDFEDIRESKRCNLKLYANSFIGYIAIAKELFNKPNWEKKLEEILKGIDFSKNNDFLNKRKNINQKNIMNIAKYFKQFI